ncbi:MAG: hypothetical protein LBT03_02060 [Holosporales bacterium]|nr:hypothetical protein [Holosporales bacterium]
MWIWKAYDLLSERTIAWKIGKRNRGTLKEFLEEIGIKDREFVTDNYESFFLEIPEKQHFSGKDLTFPIEQDNSNTRHYIGRFRRRSKITSRSLKMVDLSLLLLYHFQHGTLFQDLLALMSPILH